VRWYAGGRALDRAVDVFDGPLERRFVVRRAGRRPLVAHPAPPDEVDAVVALVARHGVHERQRLDAEAQAEELHAQFLEALHLVAQRRGALELEALAARFHLAAQRVERRVVGAIEKRAGEAEPLVVLQLRAPAHAGTQTLVDLEPNAARGARDLEQLALVGKVHPPFDGAVAQA